MMCGVACELTQQARSFARVLRKQREDTKEEDGSVLASDDEYQRVLNNDDKCFHMLVQLMRYSNTFDLMRSF